MIVNNIQANAKKVSFKGMDQVKSNTGSNSFEFYLPYDQDKYAKAEIEFIQLKKEGTDFVVDKSYDPRTMTLINGKIAVNPARIALSDQPFGYRFKLTDKNDPNEVTYHTDSGLRTENTDKTPKYVVVFRDRAPVTNPGGTIIHLMPDSHNPGYEFDKEGKIVENKESKQKALESKRNHFNQYGGNIAGIIQDIPRMSEMGYDFVLATPIFGGDERSSHGYWTANPFQITRKNGTDEDFKTLNVELFKKGMSLIADGAFVNEGMEGYRLKHIQKWGQESPYYYNFRIQGNPTIANLPNLDPKSKEGQAVFPHIKLNIVNGDNEYSFNKSDVTITKQKRDPKKLTYVQIYDERLLTPEQLQQVNKGQLITKYEKYTTGNHYEINTDKHSVLLNAFEVPEDFISVFEKRIKENQKDYTENRLAFLQTTLKFPNFNIDTQPNGFETWDGNADIAKLRYGFSNGDEEKMTLLGASKEQKRQAIQGAYQNKDQTQKVGKHWTQITKNTLIEYSANVLSQNKNGKVGYSEIIKDSKGKLPEISADAMTLGVIENIIDGNYNIPELETTSNSKERLTEDLMNSPLEAIGFSPDVTAVLGSPFISKKAFTKDDVKKTRFEFYKGQGYMHLPDKYSNIFGDMDDVYTNSTTSLVEFAYAAITQADTEGKLINKQTQELTDAGKLILPLLANDILKFEMVKALAPSVKVENKGTKMVYDENALRNITLKNIGLEGKGIAAKSPADEAKELIKLMKSGMVNISEVDKKILSENLKARIQGINENDIKMAYVLVDRTASGLNWRTDATKDVAPNSEVRDELENLGPVMDEGIEFWGGFVEAVKSVNPNSSIYAEMTDIPGNGENSLMYLSGGKSGRHNGALSLENTFAYETGVSGFSNYHFFFSSILESMSSEADTGNKKGASFSNKYESITGIDNWGEGNKNKGVLFNYPQDGVKTAHNFASNHDKPRLLSILALDNRLFHGQKPNHWAVKELAPNNGETPNYHAVAMAAGILTAMGQAMDEIPSLKDRKGAIENNSIKPALKDLVAGKFYDDKEFNPSAFGVAPLHFTINDTILQAEKKHELDLNEAERTTLFNKTLEKLLSPAMEKMLIIDKFYTVLPGRNTSYSGDEYGMTGYESPCKNLYAQNRNVADRNCINDPEKIFINTYYKDKKDINNIRRKKGLSALSNGETAWLKPIMSNNDIAKMEQEILKQNFQNPEAIKSFKEGYQKNLNNSSITAIFRYDKLSELICITHTNNVKHEESDDKPEFWVDNNIKTEINEVDLSEHKHNGTVVAGLAGGLAVGTYFVNALLKQGEKEDNVYGVCKENEKYVVKEFTSQDSYLKYLKGAKDEAKKIVLKDNLTILKKAGKIAFHGNNGMNPNHLKIQAYLNSKQYLNINKKQAI